MSKDNNGGGGGGGANNKNSQMSNTFRNPGGSVSQVSMPNSRGGGLNNISGISAGGPNQQSNYSQASILMHMGNASQHHNLPHHL